MINLYCLWCDKPLTGKQSKFCCDAHRTRYNRWSGATANQPEMTGQRPEMTGNDRETTGNDRKNTITLVLTVSYVESDATGQRAGWIINSLTKRQMGEIFLEILEKNLKHWDFSLISSSIEKR